MGFQPVHDALQHRCRRPQRRPLLRIQVRRLEGEGVSTILSNAVAVSVFEAWRQLGYAGAATHD